MRPLPASSRHASSLRTAYLSQLGIQSNASEDTVRLLLEAPHPAPSLRFPHPLRTGLLPWPPSGSTSSGSSLLPHTGLVPGPSSLGCWPPSGPLGPRY